MLKHSVEAVEQRECFIDIAWQGCWETGSATLGVSTLHAQASTLLIYYTVDLLDTLLEQRQLQSN